MDGLFHGKPYEQMDDLGGPPLFLEIPKSLPKMRIPRQPSRNFYIFTIGNPKLPEGIPSSLRESQAPSKMPSFCNDQNTPGAENTAGKTHPFH